MANQDTTYNQNILISPNRPTAQSQKMMTNVSGQQYAKDEQKGINKFCWTKHAPFYCCWNTT